MFTFPGQRSDEHVLMVIRKFIMVYVRILLVFILTIGLPMGLFLWFWVHQYPLAEFPHAGMIVGIFASWYLIFGLLFTCVGWVNEAFDLFILTDQSLIDITQVTLFRRSVTSTPLGRIQDATSDVNGLLQTLFNYGNIDIQTASGDNRIFIDRIHNPGDVARRIMDAVQTVRSTGVKQPQELQDGFQNL
ncbi:MAG: hypothetical protein V1908_02350 [Candidatus Peregrinibacteria bacterium]